MAWSHADIPDMTGKRAVVTGATNGIGLEAASWLAGKGAEVVLTGRDQGRGDAAVATIRRRHRSAHVRFACADMARLMAVRGLAFALSEGPFSDGGKPIDILLNNAGLVAPKTRAVTADGFELQFGVNYLSHFVLTALLMPVLLAAPAARIVTVASIAHKRGRIDFDDLQATRGYERLRSYAQSKLANLLFAIELDRRLRAAGARAMSVAAHPGFAMTNIFAGAKLPMMPVVKLVGRVVGQATEAGALPLLFAATAPEARPGGYYGPQSMNEMRGRVGVAKIMPHAQDAAVAARLFAVSETLTGVAFPPMYPAAADRAG